MRFTTSLAALALALAPLSAHAADDRKKDDAAAAAPVPPPNVSITRHKGSFGGQSIAYTATTGETYLTDKDDKPVAAIFATSYVKDGGDPKTRPITFLYNGGPGSGSLWLHMGAFGPKRVVLPDGKDDGAPPYPVVDNPESLLDVTDLVFIDPVGTGFSHTLGGKDPQD
jgi:carboxypeptidase C (cathepsin A)